MTLELRGLSIGDANRTLVFDIDLTIAPGSVTAVLGSNGAGKSELVLGLAGILPVRSGQVLLDGRRIDGTGPEAIRRSGLAAVPEGHRVLTDLSVDDNLRAAGLLLGRDMPARLDEVYAIFPELAERKAQLAGTLSGGQQQMVALGHALMCRPRYLLLDEMSLGLAPLIVRRLLGVVSSLKAEGVGILLIEQFTDLALGMAETALVLRGGRVRYTGPASTLSQDKDLLHTAYFGL